MENDFSEIDDSGHGEIVLQNARYKSRVRPSPQVMVLLTFRAFSLTELLGNADIHNHDKPGGTRIRWPR